MRAGMRLALALLLLGSCGCAPLPTVALRVRARLQPTQRRRAGTFEARIDCGWAFERGAASGATAAEPAPETTAASESAASPLAAVPCEIPRACAWEAVERERALIARGEAP